MTALLALEGIGRRFGGLQALQDVSFELQPGQLMGLIGPNGAGKSTLFSIIAGAVPPTSGRVKYQGKDVTWWQPHQAATAGVSRTFQLMRVFGSMTVLDNCVVAAHLRHRSRREARLKSLEILELTGLADMSNVPAQALTAPSKKRLEVARALASEPAVLLLDEVVSGLTPAEGKEAVEILRRINENGMTILMVEHVMEVIMPLCDELVVLDHGQLIGRGTPQQVSRDPAVLKAYLGED